MTTCSGCSTEWSGTRPCHCAGCHVTFSGIGLFDAHRRGNECKTPEQVGAVLNDRGLWANPPDPNNTYFDDLHAKKGA